LDSTDNTQGKTGLHYAVEEGQMQMVELLLSRGSKVDSRDRLLRTPLHLACHGGHAVIAKYLLEFNADSFERDSSGRTSMHYACCTGSVVAAIELITVLCQKDADLIHMKDHTGRTPLHYSIFNEQPDQTKVIQRLLHYGANIDCLDEDRRTPLHFAAETGRAKACTLLI
jgi:ankyrin repeat protein